jgi:hypothetical protein
VQPFLGAGVNLCGRPESMSWARGEYLPSGSELAEYLAKRVDYPYKDTENLLRVSQYVDVMLGAGPLYQELHYVFDADYAPTPVHQLLAKLPDRPIFPSSSQQTSSRGCARVISCFLATA